MRLDGIMQDHRPSVGTAVFAGPPVNDNLTFAERVKAAEIAEAARAVGEFYTERELLRFAADASEVVNLLQRRL